MKRISKYWMFLLLLQPLLVAAGLLPTILLNQSVYAQAQQETQTETGAGENLTSYTDPEGFYTLQYPSDWEVDYKEPITRFDNPITTFSEGLLSNLQIRIFDNELNVGNEVDADVLEFAPQFFQQGPGADINVEQSDVGTYQIDGIPAVAMILSGSMADFANLDASEPFADLDMKGIRLFLFTDEKDMDFYYLTTIHVFDENVPEVEAIIDSIQLTGVGENAPTSSLDEQDGDSDDDEDEDDSENSDNNGDDMASDEG